MKKVSAGALNRTSTPNSPDVKPVMNPNIIVNIRKYSSAGELIIERIFFNASFRKK